MNKFEKIFRFALFTAILLGASALANASSLYFWQEITVGDTLNVQTADSLPLGDSLQSPAMKKKSSSSLDYPVYYNAKDSNINMIQEELLILYKDAEIKYDDIQLNADYIRVNMKNKEVIAYGLTDTLGNITGKPLFVQGDEEFEADTIRYDFDTKQGIIKNVTSEFDGAYLHGGKTKRHEDETIHMINGKFTTCDKENPHFYFKLSKAKVIPDEKVVSGPAFLVIEEIPTPLGIPFGFFPNKKGATSGVIIPSYGEDARGFFLRQGGYYWAINDYMDLLFSGDIYSKGGWGAGLISNYKVRYKMKGSVSFHLNKNVISYKGFDDYTETMLYRINWKHKQDPKAHPTMNFSASVDISSSAYDRYNTFDPVRNMTGTKQSSVNFSKTWLESLFSLNLSMQHTQNKKDTTVTMTLPNMSFNVRKIYPFKQKKRSGPERFYEKIGLSYSLQAKNSFKTHEDSILDVKFKDFRNGLYHKIPISSSLKLFNYITVTPYFNYQERWYFKQTRKSYDFDLFNPEDSTYGGVVTKDLYGFNRVWDFNTGARMSTKIYGTFNYKSKYLKALRHVITPSVDLKYYPDFSSDRFQYYADYISDIYYDEITGQYDTISKAYNKFQNGIFGSPGTSGAGSVNFNLSNNLEAKVANPNDTTGEIKKVKILESLNFSTGYNLLADSLNWSPVRMTGRTTIGKLNLNFNAMFDPYAFDTDTTGRSYKINTAQFSRDGKLARITSAGLSSSIRFSADGIGGHDKNADNFLYGYPHSYVDFSIPWSFNLSYNLSYTNLFDKPNITQSVRVNGDVNLTPKWKVTFGSAYDIKARKMSYSKLELHRDLHCWEMSISIVPFGTMKSYIFTLNVKSSLLQDLKLQRRQSWMNRY